MILLMFLNSQEKTVKQLQVIEMTKHECKQAINNASHSKLNFAKCITAAP